MDDASLDRLLAGDLQRLPPLPKRVVRLFISSTFTDMTLERNSLMERVYPRLKKYCRERHGLDFQVVDMRWGVRDEATDDHQTVNLCSREIDNCQRVSLGPNFVALIGDKYGFRPLLNRIKSTEYRSLRRCLIESDINTDFLDTWYKEDLNAVPAEYLLQPISSILKNFTNKSEPELQAVDQKIWQAIQERLHDLLLIGSERLVRQGRMSERERTLKYSISVTEREVLEGCLELPETKSHCLVYVRSIVDLRDQLARYFDDLVKLSDEASRPSQLEAPGSPGGGGGAGGAGGGSSDGGSVASGSARRDSASRKASLKIGEDTISLATSGATTSAERRLERQRRLIGKFMDLTSKNGGAWQIDEEAQTALGQLKRIKLHDKLGETRRNLTVYEVHWHDQDGISAKSEEHKQYLSELTEHFYANLTRMVRAAVKSERKVKTSGLAGEVLQHSHYSLRVAAKVHGRSAELDQIRAYIQTGSCQALSSSGPNGPRRQLATTNTTHVLPMFLYGVGGSGKTSVLARVATLAGEWAKQAALLHRRRSSTTARRTSVGDESAPIGVQAAAERWDRTPCIITRFCCTTPASSSMVGMLTSVCRQLQYNFYQFGPLNGLLDKQQQQQQTGKRSHAQGKHDQLAYQRIPEDFVRLVHTFRQLVNNCRHSLHKRRAFIIIIDSVERLLAPAECSLEAKYSWLTSLARLPPNVRLIVSCGSSPILPQSGLSAQTRASAHNDDYLHLKRHFLQAHYKAHEAASGIAGDANGLASSSSSEGLSSDELSSASGSSSPEGAPAELGDRSVVVRSPGMARASITRFHLLRRLVLPVARLARGSRSFTFEEGQAVAQALTAASVRQSPVVVRFRPTSGARSGGLEVGGNSQPAGGSKRRESMLSSGGGSNHSDSCSLTRTTSHGAHSTAHAGAGLLHVRPLGARLAQGVLRQWLAEAGRNLSQQQWAIVGRALAGCSRPIFVKLAFGEVINWKSYSMQGDTKGLTFGSAWLGDFTLDTGPNSLCSELEELCRATAREDDADEQARARFKWQMLSMEQQWLNYLDYRSRKAEAQAAHSSVGGLHQQPGHSSTTTNGGELVIRVGGAAGSGSQKNASTQSFPAGSSASGSGNSNGGGQSSSSLSICHLSDTIEEAICQLFARIELQHGYLLTKHSLSYITAARNGICENELEDILSLDDVVLDDVFQYHLPPVRRIPPLLWTRIRNDLPDYLSERDADGIVVAWHHDQFRAVTQRRYLADDAQLVYIHSLLADYFMGKWAERPKPFRCTKQQVQMAAEQLESAVQQSMRRDSDQPASRPSLAQGGPSRLASGSAAANNRAGGGSFSVRNRLRSSDQHDQRLQWMQAKALRRVPHQPLYYEQAATGMTNGSTPPAAGVHEQQQQQQEQQKPGKNGDREAASVAPQPPAATTAKRRYNLRKLTELPHHLMRAGRFLDLARLVLFNYRWLFASIDALGLQSLFCDLDEARQHLEAELVKRRAHDHDSRAPSPNDQETDEGGDQFPGVQQQPGTAQDQGELSVAARDILTSAALRSLVRQVATLSDTLRLSSSAIHAQPHMLAAQLIGRLFPAVHEQLQQQADSALNGNARLPVQSRRTRSAANRADFCFLAKLLEQCYRDGAADCALLPMSHCLCTADGLKLSSLEGHPFGVTAMSLASDRRHLLAVSSKFLMWNISTGEIARDIEPRLSGSIIRGLVMCANNQFALAYTSDNLVLALEILTQQVVRLDLRRDRSIMRDDHETDAIAGLELIDQREARRFFVWTRSGLLVVLRLIEYCDSQQAATYTPAGSSPTTAAELPESEFHIAVEYQLEDLLGQCQDLGSSRMKLLNVAISELEGDKSDLIALTLACENGQQDNSPTTMRLETLKVTLDSKLGGRVDVRAVEVWPSGETDPRRAAQALALSRPSMSQLVVADSEGNVCLRRRRATKWSAPKVLLRATSRANRDEMAPLAIELESSGATSTKSDNLGGRDDPPNQVAGQKLRNKLAEFEAKIDGDCEEIRGVSRRVFGDNESTARGQNQETHLPEQQRTDQISFVKLYWPSCIVTLQLNTASKSYLHKCLMLPRDIRNVCLEPNRSQLMSRITVQPPEEAGAETHQTLARHYLIVAANRKLLIYSIEREQLLKCYDAHSKRITGLLAINTALVSQDAKGPESPEPAGDPDGASRQQFGNALATCSLDRTVNIWNLQNINKEEPLVDRLPGGAQFDSIRVNSQLPLAACLSRGQLTLWDWPLARLALVFESTRDLADGQDAGQSSPFGKCRFSSNGRYLALASLAPSLHLLACDGPQPADGTPRRGRGGPAADTPISVKQLACARPAPREGRIRSLDFFAHDSRLLVVAECESAQNVDGNHSELTSETSDELESGTSTNSADQEEEEVEEREVQEPELFERVSVACLAVPEMRRVFSFESLVPRCQHSASAAQPFLSRRMGARARAASKLMAHQISSSTTTSISSSSRRNRMVALTSDQQLIVVVEAAKLQDGSHSPQDRRKLRRRSSAHALRPQLALNLYSARDGKFVASIDLSQLQRFDSGQINSQRPPLTHLNGPHQTRQQTRVAVEATTQCVSLRANQFNRLRAIRNRERQSVVALVDDQRGLSYLVDINSKLLVACSSSWSGALTSDGRYGLSRVFPTTTTGGGGGAAGGNLVGAAADPAGGALAPGNAGGGAAPDGLQLLEMRHCQALKSLLSLEQFGALSTGASRSSGSDQTASSAAVAATTSDNSDILCGFTRPNDAYAYLCDLRQRRLLLVRLRDSHLVANFKLSAPVSHVKCSGDGYALLVGQTDGSLVPLAIADPHSSEAQSRLASHLTHRQHLLHNQQQQQQQLTSAPLH